MKWIARRARYRYVNIIMKKQTMPATTASRPPPILWQPRTLPYLSVVPLGRHIAPCVLVLYSIRNSAYKLLVMLLRLTRSSPTRRAKHVPNQNQMANFPVLSEVRTDS